MSSILVDQLGNPIVNRDVVGFVDPYDSLNLSTVQEALDRRKLYDAMGNEVPNYFARRQGNSNKVQSPAFLDKENVEDVRIFESMSGVNTNVIFEIPNPSSNEGSMFIRMRSIISVSVSTSRAKMPIIPLGENTVNGFALGNKTVAGSIIKTLTYNDEFSQQIEFFTEKSLKERKDKFFYQLGTKTFFDSGAYQISHKHFDSLMKDDLLPFNIHTFSYSEYTGLKNKFLMNSIYGCTLINEGQVQSIENLITENTFTYVAKYAKLGQNVTQDYASYQTTDTAMTGSRLLAQRKK